MQPINQLQKESLKKFRLEPAFMNTIFVMIVFRILKVFISLKLTKTVINKLNCEENIAFSLAKGHS